jgi:predicted protein tyrosine phosphatase
VSLIVCPLSDVGAVAAQRRPSHVLTLVDPGTPVATPPGLAPGRHLRLDVYDVVETFQHMEPASLDLVARILEFGGGWSAEQPMLVHCYAGISRSTAAAFTLACAKSPEADERRIAMALRRVAPHAAPNRRIVELADRLLGRDGRMLAAVEAMGESNMAAMGAPFDFAVRH